MGLSRQSSPSVSLGLLVSDLMFEVPEHFRRIPLRDPFGILRKKLHTHLILLKMLKTGKKFLIEVEKVLLIIKMK